MFIKLLTPGLVALTMLSAPALAQSPAPIDPAAFEAAFESYLEENPRLLQRLSDRLNEELTLEKLAVDQAVIRANAQAIFEAEDAVVIGNPEGTTTLVEFFDYNCTYCHRSAPDVLALIAEDPDLRVVLVDFPILSLESIQAAEVGIAISQLGADATQMQDFHTGLFSISGQVDREAAISEAVTIGFDENDVRARIEEPEVAAAIQQRIELAHTLGITGTPAWVLGESLVQGSTGKEPMAEMLENVKNCGQTVCL
jgi:protein-disulfide isomerase